MKYSFLLIACSIAGSIQAQEFKEVIPNIERVQADSIRAHIKYLASDELKGRLPNTPGYMLAMNYVITRYKSMGLEPAGENQSYLQTVKFRRAKVSKDGTRASFIKD